MPNGDPRDRFFFPTLTLMEDSYTLTWEKTTDISIRCARNNCRPFHQLGILYMYTCVKNTIVNRLLSVVFMTVLHKPDGCSILLT